MSDFKYGIFKNLQDNISVAQNTMPTLIRAVIKIGFIVSQLSWVLSFNIISHGLHQDQDFSKIKDRTNEQFPSLSMLYLTTISLVLIILPSTSAFTMFPSQLLFYTYI